MRPFPTDSKEWYLDGTNAVVTIAGTQPAWEKRGSSDGTDLAGTGAVDWSDPADRQWYIVNFFHQLHVDPVLWSAQADVDLRRGGSPTGMYDHLPPTVRQQLDG